MIDLKELKIIEEDLSKLDRDDLEALTLALIHEFYLMPYLEKREELIKELTNKNKEN